MDRSEYSMYLEHIHLFRKIENERIDAAHTDTEILDILLERARQKHEIYVEQNKIISHIDALKEHADTLSRDEYNALFFFANALSQTEIELDNELSYRIHETLLAYGKGIQNSDILICETYWCGVCEWKYYKLTGKRPTISYFEKMEDYRSLLDEVAPLTRRRYISAILNQSLYYTGKNAEALLLTSQRIEEEFEAFAKAYPDTPLNFDAYRSIIYRNASDIEPSFRMNIARTKKNTSLALNYAQRAMDLVEQRHDTMVPFASDYIVELLTAQLYAGTRTIQEYLHMLDPLTIPDPALSHKENYARILCNTATYLNTMRAFMPCSKEELKEEIVHRSQAVLDYLDQIERNNETYYVNTYVYRFIQSILNDTPLPMLKKILFTTTLVEDIDTCVHCMMVEKLSVLLFDACFTYCPEQLVGCEGTTSLEQIKSTVGTMRSLLQDMALLHDLGKYQCLPIISNNTRALVDREFSVIKLHPEMGYRLVSMTALPDAVKQAMLYHHRWHDRTHGYPTSNTILKDQPLIDLVSAADSLDAATDPYGRSYARSLSYDQILQEMEEEKDTRYAGFVVDLLEKDDVKEKIQHALHETRNNLVVPAARRDRNALLHVYLEQVHDSK